MKSVSGKQAGFAYFPHLVMLMVCALGVTLSAMVAHSLNQSEQDQREQRFQLSARLHAANLISRIHAPTDSLAVLQRVFSSIDDTNAAGFRQLADPLFNTPGLRSFCWFPRITAANRSAFEQAGQKEWGQAFSISEYNEQGEPHPARLRDAYFPLHYAFPDSLANRLRGFDIAATKIHKPLIDATFPGSLTVSGDIEFPTATPSGQNDRFLIAMPVYPPGPIPETGAARQVMLKGIVLTTFDIETLFAAANLALNSPFTAILLDPSQAEDRQQLTRWMPDNTEKTRVEPAISGYSENFDLGNRRLTLRIEAPLSWPDANDNPGRNDAFPVGMLLTILLLLLLWPLLKRSEQHRQLELSRKEALEQRRRAEAWADKLHLAVEQNPASVFIADLERRLEYVNDTFVETTGYPRNELIGQTTAILRPDSEDAAPYEAMWAAALQGQKWHGEFQTRRRDGTLFWERVMMSPLKDDDGKVSGCVGIKEDITEHEEARQRIEQLAYHDALTGLPNRLLLRDRFGQAQAMASRMHSRVALMYLDLDRFKTINDSLGHPVGDDLLKAVVARLKSCIRDSDTISRQGGDEFIVLLGDVRDGDAASRVADKIQQRMSEPFEVQEHLLSTSFSIGVALYPDDGDDFDILLQKADTAMYHAKESGRNAHRFFVTQMNEKVVEHLLLETRLRQALENREFVLYYQPQLDLVEGKIIGVEALIRWVTPEGETISPGRFVPVAEETGLIAPIGYWVLNEACRQARQWQESGLEPFVVAVNLSGVQFRRYDLITSVINALVLSDLDSQWLELELTESILIHDAEATLDSVRRLKALGVKLSVDDFGTGYSSLAYLKRFAVDKLKIDQSFVRDLASDPEDAAIVGAIIQMARSLKLKTIAEGVENETLVRLLREYQCDEIQGYWLSCPLPPDELASFVRHYQNRRIDPASQAVGAISSSSSSSGDENDAPV